MLDFGIGFSELLVIAVVGLVVLGPEDFPRMLYELGKGLSFLKKRIADLQGYAHQISHEAGLLDAKRDFEALSRDLAQKGASQEIGLSDLLRKHQDMEQDPVLRALQEGGGVREREAQEGSCDHNDPGRNDRDQNNGDHNHREKKTLRPVSQQESQEDDPGLNPSGLNKGESDRHVKVL